MNEATCVCGAKVYKYEIVSVELTLLAIAQNKYLAQA